MSAQLKSTATSPILLRLKTFLLSLLSLCTTSSCIPAKGQPGIFAGGGATWYYGDLNDRTICDEKLFSHYLTAGLLYRFIPKFAVSLSYANGEVEGADSLAIQDFNLKRNLHFRTEIEQVALHLEYRLFRPKGRTGGRISPFILGGVAWYRFNPVAQLNGVETELQPLGTEGQYIGEDGYPPPYELRRISMPIGLGADFRISKAFTTRLEIAVHYTFFDYFDDVSGLYADSSKLSSTPFGSLAVILAADPESAYPVASTRRGSTGPADKYVFAGLKLLYTPFSGGTDKNGSGSSHRGAGRQKKKNRKACPAYH